MAKLVIPTHGLEGGKIGKKEEKEREFKTKRKKKKKYLIRIFYKGKRKGKKIKTDKIIKSPIKMI